MLFPRYLLFVLIILVTGCDDLYPSSDDKREPVDPSTIGSQPGQIAPDFDLSDTENNMVNMFTELNSASGIVLYFTMWCPKCNQDTDDMIARVIPNFPNVKFFLIDYISGSISQAYITQNSYGYDSMTVLVNNIPQDVLSLYEATMGTTVVIENADSHGIVRMNEDYKDASRLIETLNALP
mgnify:CR=1 FL=1